MQLDSLFQIIQKAQKRYPSFSARLAEAEALGRWEVAVGALIARNAKAVKVHATVLWVEVAHPIWRAELHYRKKQILDILNGKTPCAKKGLTPAQEILTDISHCCMTQFSRAHKTEEVAF